MLLGEFKSITLAGQRTSQVKLNGKFVHPIEGDLTFVTENDTKFIISCKNRWSTVQKELEIQTNHYSQKRDFNFRRLASQPILYFRKQNNIQ